MSSLDSLMSRSFAAKGVVAQVLTDTPVAIRLKAKAAAGAVTSVTTTTATNIVMITANGGTDTYAFATYTTVGTLVDAINADGMFEAKVLDSLRSYASTSQFVTGAISSSSTDGIVYYDVLVDTSAAQYFAYRLTNDRSVGETRAKGSHRVHLQEIVYYATLGGASADDLQIWEVNNGVETQKVGYLSVSAAATTISFASGEAKLTSADGAELVVVLHDPTSLADSANNYLRVVGVTE